MKPDSLEHFRLLLESQLAGLEESTRRHESALDEGRTTGDFTGPDRASDLESLEVDAAVTESEHRLAEKIRHALARIEAGTYGLCESCGLVISEARLKAKPSVSLCVPCQARHDATH